MSKSLGRDKKWREVEGREKDMEEGREEDMEEDMMSTQREGGVGKRVGRV